MEISVPSAQLCCEPKNALKKKSLFIFKKNKSNPKYTRGQK